MSLDHKMSLHLKNYPSRRSTISKPTFLEIVGVIRHLEGQSQHESRIIANLVVHFTSYVNLSIHIQEHSLPQCNDHQNQKLAIELSEGRFRRTRWRSVQCTAQELA